MKTRIVASALLFSLAAATCLAAPRVSNDLAEALQDRDYARAVEVIDALLLADGQPRDYLLFLKGRALHFAGDDAQAIDVYRQFTGLHPDSQWIRHVRFAMAVSYSRSGEFKQAEEIYRTEAEYLLSDDRKQQVADIYLASADELFEPSDDRKPDFQRALQFYLQALEVGTKPDRTAAIELRVARCWQQLQKYDEAAKQLQAFQNDRPEDDRRVEASFRLGECQFSLSQLDAARRTWQDLLALKPKGDAWNDQEQEFRAQSAFRVASTYQLPTARSTANLSLGIASLESFIASFPEHELIDDAYLLMARSYESAHRFDDAAKLLTRFVSDEQYKDRQLIPEAQFQLGRCQQLQKKFALALRTWQDYLSEHPAHGRWSNAQRAIVDTEFLQAEEARSEQEYGDARTAYLGFIAKYPLDQRAQKIMFTLGKMNYDQGHFKQALADWQQVVSKYPQSEIASLAQLMIATTWEERLNDPEKALEEYKELTWGGQQQQAKQRIRRLTSKQIVIRTERVFRSNQMPEIKLTSRNIENVDVRIYAIDLETYFRKMHLATGVESLDVSLIDPDHTFEFQIPEYTRYRETDVEIPLAADRNTLPTSGVYVVTVGSETLEATTMVLQSDLDVIVKGSRHEVFVYAQNMISGEPWPDVRLLVSDGQRILGEGTTGDDGVFQQEFAELKSSSDVRVFAAKTGNAASNRIDLQGLQTARGLTPRGYIDTDRATYRAGQLVNIRALVRRVAGDVFQIDEGKSFELSIIDPRNRTVWQEQLKLNEWGTVHSRFLLPESSVQGQYRIVLNDGEKQSFQGGFQVTEFQLQNVELKVDSERDVYYRGEKIRGTISANYVFGGSLSGKTVRYQLGNGRTYTASTDKQGNVEFAMETREFHESQQLPLRVELPELNLSTVRTFVLSATGFAVSMDTPRPCYLGGEAFPVQLRTTDATGEPVSRSLTLRVFRQSVIRGRTAQIPVESHPVKTDSDGRGNVRLQLSKGGVYVVRAEGMDRFNNAISGEHRVQVSDQDDDVRLRILAGKLQYKVGQLAKVRVHWREQPTRALVTYQGARVLGYQIVRLNQGENTVEIPLLGKHAPNFDLHVALITDNVQAKKGDSAAKRFHEASSSLLVQRQLQVEIDSVRKLDQETLRPGESIEVRVTTKDAQGTPVAAELSLALVQQALIDRFGEGNSPIEAFFRVDHRQSAVRTASSISFQYRPPTMKVSGLLLAERARVRLDDETREELRSLNGAVFDVEAAFELNTPESGVAEHEYSYRIQTDMAPNRAQQSAELAVDSLQRQPSAAQERWSGQAAGFLADPLVGKNPNVVLQLDYRDSNRAIAQLKGLRPERASTVAALYSNGILNHVQLAGESAASWGEVARELADQRALLMTGDSTYETGYWNPSVITDENGVAEVAITIPDLSTAWRLAAKGITKQTLVGQDQLKLVAKKQLFGTLKLPLAFTDGDELRIPATIHNDAIKRGKLTATLRMRIAERTTESVQTIDVDGEGEHELFFPVQIRDPDKQSAASDVAVEFQLVVAANGHEDRFVRSVPLIPRGMPVFATSSGSSSGDTTAWVAFPENVLSQAPSLQIVVGPSVKQSLLDVLFESSPNWRRELVPLTDSSASNLMAALALQRLFSNSREAEQPHAEAIDQRIRAEVGQIVASQLDDGGWGWAGNTQASDRNVTARTVWALSIAKSAGYQVADETNDKALSYLRGQLSQTGNADYESKTLLLHGLVTAGEGDFALANRLYRNRPSLSTSALLHLALSLTRMNRPSLAADVLRLVESRNFNVTTTRRKSSQASLPWSHSPVELRALYALALQKAEPQSAKTKRVIERLLSDRQGARWNPDKATGPATMAICLWLDQTQFATDRYQLSVYVNETKVKDVTFDRDMRTETIGVPASVLKENGKQQIRFRMTGRGQFTYQCVLKGFVAADQLKSTSSEWRVTRLYEHAPLERKGKPVARGFDVLRGGYRSFQNQLKQLPTGKRGDVRLSIRRSGVSADTPTEHLEYLIVTEPLPAGVAVIEDSIQGAFDRYQISPGAITFYVGNRFRWSDISFSVHGYLDGEYNVMPTTARDAYRPDQIAISTARQLQVLTSEATSEDEYKLTPRELYELGQLAYQDGRMAAVVETLEKLLSEWKLRPEFEKHSTSMLLDAFLEIGPSHKVVHYFEIVKEKYPELEVPYDKILKIGKAYHEMGEYERCYLIFRATVESSFTADSRVAGFLQQQHEALRAVDFMNDLLQQYPPESYAASATFDLAQQVYALSESADQHKRLREQKITRVDLIRQSAAMLRGFLTAYPHDPAADQAAFSFANALLDLKQYEVAIEACRKFAQRYTESDDVDGFWYTIGYCHFALGQHRQALDICQKVVEMRRRDPKSGRMVPSSNRERAIYISGQIYHSLGNAAEAIREYTRVHTKFADAQEAINYFTRKEISLPEVTRVELDERVKCQLSFRNVTHCVLQVYRIDLMKFGLLKRNLADITSINLAGIKPLYETKLDLGDGKDYRDRKREIELPLEKEGAYLVVGRADDLHTSGLVLISGLQVEVSEDPASGRVRTTVRDRDSDYVAGVHVKVIGSRNEAFVSGETDLRGVFVADGINGETTTIAQLDRDRYAFFRGDTFLGPHDPVQTEAAAPQSEAKWKQDYGERLLLEGVRGRNSTILQRNLKRQQDLFFNEDSGVRVKAVK